MPTIPAHLTETFKRFTDGPSLVRQAISGLDAGTLNRRPPGEDWSIRDIVIHLADAEIVGAGRFRQTIAEEGGTLTPYSEDTWKRRLHYLWRDPEFELSLFQMLRWSTADLLRQCDAATWERSSLHPERGPLTVADLLRGYAEHVEEHVAQIAKFRQS